MSTLADIFDVLSVKRTEIVKGIVSAIFSSEDQAAGDPVDLTTDESQPAEWWQHYGFASRPPVGSQAAVLRAGDALVAFASRAIDTVKAFGKLNDGDVAIYSKAGNVIRVNADASVTILAPDGGANMVISISPKRHAITMVTAGGMAFEMSDSNGITLNAGQKELTLVSQTKVQIIAPEMIDMVGTHKLHMGGTRPTNLATVTAGGAPNVLI